MSRKLSGVALLILAAGLLNRTSAQDPRGTILGRVLDASGAIIPEANVQVTKTDTGVTVKSTTNENGQFSVPFLNPGMYRLTVEKPGFKTYSRENVQLRVSESVDLPIQMDVGSASERVEVQASTPVLETDTSTPGQIIDERRLLDIPQKGGDAFDLVKLAPGVVNMTTLRTMKPDSPEGTSSISVDGSPQFSVQWQIDGLDDTVNDENKGYSRVAYIPPSGAITELKLQASPYDASVGHVLGPVVSVSSKNGTNDFHGTLYYWFKNSALDSNDFFINKAGQTKPVYQDHRYGITFGGPITIPHVYRGRDKTFFFFAWEGNRYTSPATTAGQTSTVPTAAERIGNFSELLKLGSQYQVYNPFTTVAAGNGRYRRTPIPGNVIPASLLNPVGLKLASLFPLPNQPGTSDGQNNYFYPDVRRILSDSFMGRLDHSFSANNRLFLRMNHYAFHIPKNALGVPASIFAQDQINQGAVLDDVWVLSPTLVLNLRYGLTGAEFPEQRATQGIDLTSLGFSPALAGLVDPSLSTVPRVKAAPFSTLSNWSSGDGTNTYVSHNLLANATKLKGTHTLRFGADARLLRSFGNRFPAASSPDFTFPSSYTQGPLDNSPAAPVGDQLAAMLMGIPGGSMTTPYTNSYALQNSYVGLYLQDDYKITPKLTLNLGLRYEVETPPVERYDRLNAGFDRTTPNALTAQAIANFARNPVTGVPSFSPTGGLIFVNQSGNGRSPYHTTNEFLPRIGIAWQITPKTVLRSGYGIYFASLGVATFSPFQTGFTQTTPIQASLDNGVTYVANLTSPFPNGLIPASGASGGINTGFNQAMSFYDPNMKPPYSQRWSFGIQRYLPGQFVVEVNYVGNRVTRLGVNQSINNTPAQYLSKSPSRDQTTINYLTAQFPDPFYGLNPLYPATLSRGTLLQPFPQFSDLTVQEPIGYSWYHALQIRFERRLVQGLTVQGAYTHSKYMQATEFLNPTDTIPYRTLSDMDRPNVFAASSLWELPLGHGRRFLSQVPTPVNAVLGGWQINGDIVHQSGAPLAWANIIFNGNINNIPLPADQQSADRWFNVQAGFNTVSSQQLANNIRTFPLRFSGIRAEGQTIANLSLIRNFQLAERLRAQFRAEVYNVANHPVFAAPNVTPSSSAFGTISSDVSEPREWQFALKFLF